MQPKYLQFIIIGFVVFFSVEIKAQRNVTKDSKTGIFQVQAGRQTWMLQNLNVTHFKNGDAIPQATTNEAWNLAANEGKPAWCYYNNISDQEMYYGKLYNWFAVNDPRGLSPEGWHVANENDWKILISTYGDSIAGGALKIDNGWMDWSDMMTCKNCDKWNATYRSQHHCDFCKDQKVISIMRKGTGNNVSGFAAWPGGCRFTSGEFFRKGRLAQWWTSGLTNENQPMNVIIYHYENGVYLDDKQSKGVGMSVRCIKDN